MGDEEDLSDHCQSMREALTHCQKMLQQIKRNTTFRPANSISNVPPPATSEASPLAAATDSMIKDSYRSTTAAQATTIDEIDLAAVSASQFQQRYIADNRPCLIHNCAEPDFGKATAAWVKQQENYDGTSCSVVNVDWFRKACKSVPVRRTTTACAAPARAFFGDGDDNLLDVDGRAAECETVHMAIDEWIRHLRGSGGGGGTDETNPNLYLKDWHLQQELSAGGGSNRNNNVEELYTVPFLFPHDLLNAFLMRFTRGDYRFVYWGPAGSCTARHSDVLNSFSWSYNVHGTKEWTFYDELSPAEDAHGSCSHTTRNTRPPTRIRRIRQCSGDLMFVPARLQHSVVNLEETLSINHNWITTTNLDLVWECIATELGAVETELQSWSVEGYEARENMLRGCVGLDVTAFLFMTLVRGLELLLLQQQQAQQRQPEANDDQQRYDLLRLSEAIQSLLVDHFDNVNLQERLNASLADEQLGSYAMQTAKQFVETVNFAFV